MNKSQKEVLQSQLNTEKKSIKELRRIYERALQDCKNKIMQLSARADMEPENLQSVIYQRNYQEAIKGQLEGVLSTLQSESFATVSEYLANCYQEGYTGVMYDLMNQGIPFILPISQKEVVKAIQTDSKLSTSLYGRLGEDINRLRNSIRSELSRGIASGSTWNQIASRLSTNMNSTVDVFGFNRAYNNSIRIVRTEGHRIQIQSAMDAQRHAKEKGADIVKQWDATMDGKTRPLHRMLDGQIKEIDDDFEIGRKTVSAPGMFNDPAEDCNCRCALLQRARWALDDDELKTLKERAEYFGLDKSKDFETFKQKYLKLPDNADIIKVKTLKEPTGSENAIYDRFFNTLSNRLKVKYNAVENHNTKMTEEEIIKILSGGDKTSGSCASLGLAYIGQKQGWNVLDFRGGESQSFFSNGYNLMQLSQIDGIRTIYADGKTAITVGNRLLKECEVGKEYYLCCGRHASIVRKLENSKLQYLELQSEKSSGWTDFDGNPRYTLVSRFGCNSRLPSVCDFMIDISDSNFDTDDFKSLLGYINTAESEQKKGQYGTIK